jgi:hypothetical protein
MSARFAAVVLGVLVVAATAARAQQSPPPVRGNTTQRPAPVTPRPSGGLLRVYPSPYYEIHTDLTGDELREAILRMTRMFEEYRSRTRDFSGTVGHKFPFYLFRNQADYLAAGGAEGSAGYFDPNTDTLSAIAGEKTDQYTWQTVQHEGFHQYAKAVIGGELPTWVNEGLAEYFGEAVFTGDNFVSGVIPPERLARVKKEIQASKPGEAIKGMMLMKHADWNKKLAIDNYDLAWSMVHFLAHGENGRYQKAFASFMRALGNGRQWEQAWVASFGSAAGFEQRWRDYWLKLPDNPTADLYAKATVQTLSGVLARAWSQRQAFGSFDEFAAAAGAGNQIKIADPDWLPPELIAGAFEQAKALRERGATITLLPAANGRLPQIVCTLKTGQKLTGHFTMRGGQFADVTVDEVGKR